MVEDVNSSLTPFPLCFVSIPLSSSICLTPCRRIDRNICKLLESESIIGIQGVERGEEIGRFWGLLVSKSQLLNGIFNGWIMVALVPVAIPCES